ncbi:hypothetical protein [Fructilactobacillus frigidiflavus]|uniref:hypothetical protein n=1 Tax=Fructilactobacillus frigidiflavus TaxID=3242688 RepID=UPI0037571004
MIKEMELIDYNVSAFNFMLNDDYDFDNPSGTTMDLGLAVDIIFSSVDKTGYVRLQCEVGSLENPKSPFFLRVEMLNIFNFKLKAGQFKANQSDITKMRKMLKTEALDTAYPYLRQIVNTLSAQSNSFPGYNLPILSLSEEIKQSGNINFIDAN